MRIQHFFILPTFLVWSGFAQAEDVDHHVHSHKTLDAHMEPKPDESDVSAVPM